MKTLLVNLFPSATIARYQLASYILKAYVDRYAPDEHDISVLNMPESSAAERVVARIRKHQADVVGFSCYSWNMDKVREAIPLIREDGDAILVCGGPEISLESIPNSHSGAHPNYYVIGEGERPFHELLSAFKNGMAPATEDTLPSGVATVRDNVILFGGAGRPFESLDAIPSIYLDNAIEERFINNQQAFVETQRGCRYRCSYCLYHHHRDKTAYYSLDRVRQELTHLVTERKITALRFMDATMTSDLERAKRIVEHLADMRRVHGVELPWIYWEWAYMGVDEEFIEMVSALRTRDAIYNCDSIPARDAPQCYNDLLTDYVAINSIGLQSMHAPSLRSVRRAPIIWDKFVRFMDMVRRHNVVLKIDLILGLPHETPDTFLQGLNALLPLLKGTDHVLNIHRLQLLSGSRLFDQAEEFGLNYAPDLPRYVLSTPTIAPREMIELSRLSGLVFRVVNSPLRTAFFNAYERMGGSVKALTDALLDQAARTPEMAQGHLFSDDVLADEYWNKDIFQEVNSRWLAQALGGVQPRR